MSTYDADDRDTMGYFLPENSQLRLQKLRDYAEFLSHIAQPRMPDAEQEGLPKINAEQVAICLEFLVEQMGLVLSDLSFPAYRAESDAAPAADETPYAAESMPYDTGEHHRFGITLDQVDTLNRLIDMIAAHGDVVTTSHATELADHTLSLLATPSSPTPAPYATSSTRSNPSTSTHHAIRPPVSAKRRPSTVLGEKALGKLRFCPDVGRANRMA